MTGWFGQFELAPGTAGSWRVGPYRLWARRLSSELSVTSAQIGDAMDDTLAVEVPSDSESPSFEGATRRFGLQSTATRVTVLPSLADRPVVVSPEEPLLLPPGERVTLFISIPVWFELTVDGGSVPLVDEPTHRPTDTWFGGSTMRGELCYAVRTAARMSLDSLPIRPHRVISEVEIKNTAKNMLTVEKLKIPVVHQSVYASAAGGLWTEAAVFDHLEGDSMASVRLGRGAPDHAPKATLVSGPRTPMDQGLLTRTFGSLMG